MRINSINSVNQTTSLNQSTASKIRYANLTSTPDMFNKSSNLALDPQVHFENGQKIVSNLSFGGLNVPKLKPADLHIDMPAIQMKVSGVTRFQDNMQPGRIKSHNTFSINRLSDGPWEDGDALSFKVAKLPKSAGLAIQLFSKDLEEIGHVPDEIADHLIYMLKKHPKDFKFELSNMVAGNTPGASTIGLRVNLKYTGKDPQGMEAAKTAFDKVLNDPDASKKAFFYQPMKSPDEVLDTLFNNVRKEYGVKGEQMVQQMEKSIKTIAKELDSPENKNILLLCHCKPDGDTLGSANGLSEMLKMLYPEKHVEVAVADEIPSLFRKNLPGVEQIKHPYSEEQIANLEAKIAKAKANGEKAEKIQSAEESLKIAKNPSLILDKNKNYDSVVLLDVPSPARFTNAFKPWLEGAKTVMYVDHHPFEQARWDSVAEQTGVHMSDIVKKNHAWVADQVAAASQLVGIIASKLKPEINPLNPANFIKTVNSKDAGLNEHLNNAVKSFATGTWTDTSGFSRTANLLTKDIKDKNGNPVPVQNRPNYFPEGNTKYWFKLTNNAVNKKWFHDNIVFVLSYREKMLETAMKNHYANPDLGFGYVKASYKELSDILENAQMDAPETNFSDVVNEMKLCEVMSALKSSSRESGKGGSELLKGLTEEVGPFDEDKIAIFASESEKAGELNTEGKVSQENALRFSFRSGEGTPYAEFLASLFNGGGHGSAAGGHLKGKNITLDSTFSAKVNGKIVKDRAALYDAMRKNYELQHDINIPEAEAKKMCSKIELVEDAQGETPTKIMEDITRELRTHDPIG